MNERTPKNLFTESLDRLSGNDDFIPAFYTRFLATSDTVRKMFISTNFERQNRLLASSLRISAAAISGEPQALQYLRERAERHDRHHLNIEPELYDVWLEAIVQTASEFDDIWNEETEDAWRHTLSLVIQQMVKHY